MFQTWVFVTGSLELASLSYCPRQKYRRSTSTTMASKVRLRTKLVPSTIWHLEFTVTKEIKRNDCACACTCVPDGLPFGSPAPPPPAPDNTAPQSEKYTYVQDGGPGFRVCYNQAVQRQLVFLFMYVLTKGSSSHIGSDSINHHRRYAKSEAAFPLTLLL